MSGGLLARSLTWAHEGDGYVSRGRSPPPPPSIATPAAERAAAAVVPNDAEYQYGLHKASPATAARKEQAAAIFARARARAEREVLKYEREEQQGAVGGADEPPPAPVGSSPGGASAW